MKVRIQMVIEAGEGEPDQVEEIARLERGSLRPEELGLTLAEAKVLLHGMQQAMVTEQIAEYLENFKACPHCGAPRTRKGQHPIAYRPFSGNSTSSVPGCMTAHAKTTVGIVQVHWQTC